LSNYALWSDLVHRVDGLGAVTPAAELIPDLCKTTNATLQQAFLELLLSNACGLIDAYLNKHYEVPICTDQSVPFLKELALDLAEYDLWKRAVGDDVPTKVKDAMERAIAILRDIAEGKIVPFSQKTRLGSIDVSSDTPYFDEESMRVF
jgi:phage gp36-like protein